VIRKKKDENKKVSIFYANWSNGIAVTYLAKAALEANDFDVTITNLAPGMIFGELSKDDSKGDVFLDAFRIRTKIT
jgi:glycine betaine/proline transport system substrate-binding protein